MSHRQDDLFLDISYIETDLANMHAYIDRLETQMYIRRTHSTRARQNSISSSHGGASVSNSDGGDDNQAAGGVLTGKGPVHTSTPNPGSLRPDGGPLSRHIRGTPNRGGLGNNGSFYKDGQANKVNSSRPKEIKPATFDGKCSWIDFRSHFDICAKLNGWSKQENDLHLAVSLRGSAQSILGNLHGDSKKDFTSLCRALEERFAPANQTELYRAQLRERRQKATETIPELGQDIRRLTNLAYSSAPIDVRETLAKEQFIDALFSSDMRLRIKQSRPRDLNEAICHAVELDAYNNADKRLHESTSFVRSAHIEDSLRQVSGLETMVSEMNIALTELRREVNEIKAAQNVHSHISDQVTNVPNTKVVCFFCKKEGHLKRQCRKYKQWKAKQAKPAKDNMGDSSPCNVSVGSTETLSKAGQGGLFVKANMYGYTVNFLIDTGATVSLVAPHIYHLCAAQLGKTPVIDELGKPILTADMTPLKVKGTTKLSFAVKGMSFQHQMVVMSDLDIDGILGLDFMQKYSCSIDVAKRLLLVQGQTTELAMKGKVGCLRVLSGEEPKENVNIPVCTKKVSEKAHRSIRKRAHITKLSQKHYHDRKRHWERFRPADRVNVLSTPVGKSPKFTKFRRSPYQMKKKMSDVTYLVDCDRQGKDQVIHVGRMKRLYLQKPAGEAGDAPSSKQTGYIADEESGSDEPSVKYEQGDDQVNDYSDLPTVPCARSGRQIMKPAWHANYE